MGFFTSNKNKSTKSLYSGGNGSSIETAIIINEADWILGIRAEYDYIIEKYGEVNKGWKLQKQGTLNQSGRTFDILNIELPNSESKSIYFDITNFHGKF